jgi:hypothetical protein
MRRLIPLLAVAVLAGTAVPASAVSPIEPKLRVQPRAISFGQAAEIRGRDWPVLEFCRPRVRISLRSDQNAFRIATARVRQSGRWRTTWVPRRAEVGAGRWRLVARQMCESGDDGSPNPLRRSVAIAITR